MAEIHSQDLLVELGCEELPPKALDRIRDAFYDGIRSGLEKNGIDFDGGNSHSYSTPRRLAVLIRDVASHQPDQEQERYGPAVSVAFDDTGEATTAALGFARSVGRDVTALETRETDKGECLYARLLLPGKALNELIFPVLEQSIKQLPVPRPMRWSDHDFSFVRPVHWLVVMHGSDVLQGSLLGQRSGNLTRGHRVHRPGPHHIKNASDYLSVLEQAFVLADQHVRAKKLLEGLVLSDGQVRIQPELFDEVNNLVEWPVPVTCSFDEEFLSIPHEVLIASMQDHQRFFPILETTEPITVSNRFIAVSNLESENPTAVREGYERVIRPRLADARFFFEKDLEQPLERFSEKLDGVVFQEKIGTIGDKSRRITQLSKKIANHLASDEGPCMRAATLSKCDLMSLMVGEFPELQGVMGKHYALAAGEPTVVAEAIEEHYLPRFAGDEIPTTETSQVVSIADRTDTLVGIFAAGLKPTGNKDPFALRRAALGLVRILLEAGLDLPLNRLLALASNEISRQLTVEPGLLAEIRSFIVQRTRNYYREQGFSSELINAALSSGWETLPDLDARIRALSNFMGLESAAMLAAANKRIGNILRKSKQQVSKEIDTNKLILKEEEDLFSEVIKTEKLLLPILELADYPAGLEVLARLRDPVDRFFDSVMVMDEDPVLRANRLALLARLKSLFDGIADLSVLG